MPSKPAKQGLSKEELEAQQASDLPGSGGDDDLARS